MIDALKATTGNNVIAIFDNHCDSNQKFKTCNLLVSSKSLPKMFDMVKKIFENNKAYRINVILQDIWNIKDSDVQVYKTQLQKISDFILNSDRHIVVNLLNGFNTLNDKPYGCECGTNTFTVAPNGKLYTCPAFYFEDKDRFCIGDLDTGFSFDDAREFKIESSKKCNACKNLSCNRCVYINKKMTNEFRVSPEIQCTLSSITQKMADDLKKKLDEKNEALTKEMVDL
jgi:CXXX repeat peptide maturase